MAETSSIEWTDATWNPVTGCTLVSEGCRHCYAAQLAATRLKNHPSRQGLARLNAQGEAKFTGEVRLNEQWLNEPLRWKRPRRIFVCAHGDLFHEAVPDEWIDRVFAVMALAPQHTFQVLTKRPERMCDYLRRRAGDWQTTWPDANPAGSLRISRHEQRLAMRGAGWPDATLRPTFPLPNVWLGTSVEDQATADDRIPHLLATPAAVRFISAEPLLGPVDLTLDSLACLPCPNAADGISMDPHTGAYECCSRCDFTGIGDEWGIDWVIVGGESGRNARPMHPDWARSLRDQCVDAGVPFFLKQWGDWVPRIGAVDGWSVSDDAEISRFDHVDWDDDGSPGAPYRPMWCDERDDDTMARVGKAAAGRSLDGQTWDQMPTPATPGAST